MNLKGRSLITICDFSREELRAILDTAHRVKNEKKQGQAYMRFASKTLAMFFEKRSTRTRCSFETAFGEEGGHPVFLTKADTHLGEKETLEDTARVIGRMFSGIVFRGYAEKTAKTLARYSGLPVYNALTDLHHPTQALADIMTIEEIFGNVSGKKLVYIGDGRNNVAHSLIEICPIFGIDISIVTPTSLLPNEEILARAKECASAGDSRIEITDDLAKGVSGADAIYTDVWVSMGEEAQKEERIRLLRPFQVTKELMAKTGKSDTIFLHCLPAVREMEVTGEVFDGPASRVWDQAENRKHTIKALMLLTM
jgi:ornithine carbamoyltransferase